MIQFPVPKATPQTAPYWEAASQGVLTIQYCDDCCRHYFYPRSFCPHCASRNVRWTEVSGRARLDSYIINRRPLPGTEQLSPIIAIVQLDEGPRMMTNIVGVDPRPANLPLDAQLTVAFESRGDMTVPVFTLAEVAR